MYSHPRRSVHCILSSYLPALRYYWPLLRKKNASRWESRRKPRYFSHHLWRTDRALCVHYCLDSQRPLITSTWSRPVGFLLVSGKVNCVGLCGDIVLLRHCARYDAAASTSGNCHWRRTRRRCKQGQVQDEEGAEWVWWGNGGSDGR